MSILSTWLRALSRLALLPKGLITGGKETYSRRQKRPTIEAKEPCRDSLCSLRLLILLMLLLLLLLHTPVPHTPTPPHTHTQKHRHTHTPTFPHQHTNTPTHPHTPHTHLERDAGNRAWTRHEAFPLHPSNLLALRPPFPLPCPPTLRGGYIDDG